MILRHLSVRDFKGIDRASFDDLSERLNLFRGPNEAGKTTLVDALHFGLFEQSSGVAAHKRALQTWGGEGAPEVVIDLLDDAGDPWRITKRFLHAPSTELAGRNAVYRGRDAETRLRDMLGTRPGNRHGVTPEDLGVWPLLWVRQGEAGAAIKEIMTEQARGALLHTLSGRTGALAAGPLARRVRTDLEAFVEAHLSPGGRPRGALADATQAVEEARLRRDDARETLDKARIDRDAVRELTQRLEDLDARVAGQTARAAASDAAIHRQEAHEAAVEDTRALEAAAARALQDASERLSAAREAHTRQATDREALEGARVAARHAKERFESAEAEARRSRTEVVEAADAVTEARAAVEQSALQAEAHAVAARRRTLEARIDEAREVEERLRALETDVRSLPTDRDVSALEDGLARIDAARAARRPVQIRLTGPDGTTVPVDVTPGNSVEVGGWTLAVAEPAHEDDPVVVAEQALASRLDALGIADIDTARRARVRRKTLDAERTRLATRLEVLAPEGRVALELALSALAPADGAATPRDPAEAERARTEAETRLDAAHRMRSSASARVHAARTERSEADATLRAIESRLAASGDLDEAELSRLERTVADAAERLEAARQRARDALSEAESTREAIRDARDETVARDRLTERRDSARAELTRCETELARARAHGPWTAWRRAETLLAEAEVRRDTLQAQAEAASRALEAVRGAWSSRQTRLAGPVRRLVLRDLPPLFPGSSPALDEEGDLIGLRTGEVVETFPSLSAGSREQLGVLLRLALARVLGEGRRVPMILDDALVHSDSRRRARVVDLLRRAADDVQILVFTSHDDDFDRLAADRVFEVRGRPSRGG